MPPVARSISTIRLFVPTRFRAASSAPSWSSALCMIPTRRVPSGEIASPSIPRFACRPLALNTSSWVPSADGTSIRNLFGSLIERRRVPVWRSNSWTNGPYSSETKAVRPQAATRMPSGSKRRLSGELVGSKAATEPVRKWRPDRMETRRNQRRRHGHGVRAGLPEAQPDRVDAVDVRRGAVGGTAVRRRDVEVTHAGVRDGRAQTTDPVRRRHAVFEQPGESRLVGGGSGDVPLAEERDVGEGAGGARHRREDEGNGKAGRRS